MIQNTINKPTPEPPRWLKQMYKWGGIGLVLMLMASLLTSAAQAATWQPRSGCSHTVVKGDTLNGLEKRYDVSKSDMMDNTPWIRRADLIILGKKIDVCESPADGPRLVNPGNNVEEWAEAVLNTKPDWAKSSHVLFLVAIGGPESGWDRTALNDRSTDKGWSNGVYYDGSFGVIQIRIRRDPPKTGLESVRNRWWLSQDLDNQAEAGWRILKAQGRDAWGPHKPWRGTAAIMPGTGYNDCVHSSVPNTCRGYWTAAADAINVAESR